MSIRKVSTRTGINRSTLQLYFKKFDSLPSPDHSLKNPCHGNQVLSVQQEEELADYLIATSEEVEETKESVNQISEESLYQQMENFSNLLRNKEDDKIIVHYQECTVNHLFVRPSSEQYRIPLLKELITRRMKTLSTDFCNFDTVEDATRSNVNDSQTMVTNTVATTNLPPSSSHSAGHQAQTSSSVGTAK
uniref:Uncharacterized protein n=1 Tax=Daphnia galeata TaxID=27404 RepID=A0A8J2WJQ2_9CRUS|nr:unnamed protein product [Daphnia galeata]